MDEYIPDFKPINIGEFQCQINRNEDDDYDLLSDFSDAIPAYNKINGPHLSFFSKLRNSQVIIKLNKAAIKTIKIEGSNNMTDEEYYLEFVNQKKKIVENLVRNIYNIGFEVPSPVQALTIIELIQYKDALVQFKAGTGKTHAFLFGLLWGFDPNSNLLQYVFITSTHEVADQIYIHIKNLLPATTNILLCIGQKKAQNISRGGFRQPINTSSLNNIKKSVAEEKKEFLDAQIIVCTMGKFYDNLCNKKWNSSIKHLKAICVDEFDNIIVSNTRSSIMNTEEQMKAIMQQIPINTQRVFFSATVIPDAYKNANKYFREYRPDVPEPLIILLDMDDYTLESIKQYYIECDSYDVKKNVLLDLLAQCRIAQGIIFANKIETTIALKKLLDEQVIPISATIFHGSLNDNERSLIHRNFSDGKVRLLITTDVMSRGVDIRGVNVVINFDMPDTLEKYIHRVGRSGRYGRKGVAISLITVNRKTDELPKVAFINEHSKNNIMVPIPEYLDDLL